MLGFDRRGLGTCAKRAEITRDPVHQLSPSDRVRRRRLRHLYREKLDLLLHINRNERVTWSGTTRSALQDAVVVPRPDGGHLPIWLGTGGSPDSSVRAGQLGLPISYGIIGGQPERFGQLADRYRQAHVAGGHRVGGDRVVVGNPGLFALQQADSQGIFWDGWPTVMAAVGRQRGFAPPNRAKFEAETTARVEPMPRPPLRPSDLQLQQQVPPAAISGASSPGQDRGTWVNALYRVGG